MNSHDVFYYPYSYFEDDDSPLLKLAALYFDKFYILDPELAHHDGVGISFPMRNNMKLLHEAGILELVKPSEVFKPPIEDEISEYEALVTDGIKADLNDNEFIRLCQQSARKQGWNISIAKIPSRLRDIPQLGDGGMRRMLSRTSYSEETYFESFTEYREIPGGKIEYRVLCNVEFGEAVMINHALVSGLLYKGATPITDDKFHFDAFKLKFKRAMDNPEIKEILEDIYSVDKINETLLVMQAFKDPRLELATIPNSFSLEEILKYRFKHENDLKECRKALCLMTSKIQNTPWSPNFEREIHREIISEKVAPALLQAKQTRDEWMRSKMLDPAIPASLGGLVSLIAATTPLLPLSLVIAGATTVLTVRSWLKKRKAPVGNGLHYFVDLQERAKKNDSRH